MGLLVMHSKNQRPGIQHRQGGCTIGRRGRMVIGIKRKAKTQRPLITANKSYNKAPRPGNPRFPLPNLGAGHQPV